jgi:hypothetical protein
VVHGGCTEAAGHINGVANWQAASFAVSGNAMTSVVFCPGHQAVDSFTYSVDGGALVFYFAPDMFSNGVGEVFARQ